MRRAGRPRPHFVDGARSYAPRRASTRAGTSCSRRTRSATSRSTRRAGSSRPRCARRSRARPATAIAGLNSDAERARSRPGPGVDLTRIDEAIETDRRRAAARAWPSPCRPTSSRRLARSRRAASSSASRARTRRSCSASAVSCSRAGRVEPEEVLAGLDCRDRRGRPAGRGRTSSARTSASR